MQTPLQTVPVQALRSTRFVERIALGPNRIPFLFDLQGGSVRAAPIPSTFDVCSPVGAAMAIIPKKHQTKTRRRTMRKLVWTTISIVTALLTVGAPAYAQDVDWQKVDDALGRKPAISGDIHRYGFPRSDLSVTLDGVTIKPALALGGWVAFKPMGSDAMVMGDLVLLESEINPVMLKMIEDGLDITAVHNHLLRANPATFYMHVGGHGDPAKMAAVIRDALAVSKTPLSMPTAAAPPPAIDLNTAELDQIIGVKGQANGAETR
jgi:hypothetical protein